MGIREKVENDMKIVQLKRGTKIAMESIVPFSSFVKEMRAVRSISQGDEIAVALHLMGDVSCQFLMQAERDFFAAVGQSMFGLSADSPYLESFIGEFGNMVGGSIAMNMQDQMNIDLSPPSVYMNRRPNPDFIDAFCLPIVFDEHYLVRVYYLFNHFLRDGDKRVC